MDMKDRVVIVTGSAAGIGAAAARMLAKAGARVVINYTKSEADAKAVEAECRALGADTLLVKANVAADADCRRMADAAMAKWGRLDGLMNNAGQSKFVNHPDLDGLDAADFQAIYGVNVVGAFQMVRACAPHMRKTGHGSVVNISSIAGVMGVGSSIAYAASKGALNTLTLSLARALAPEIQVNCLCPGFVQGRWMLGGLGEERYNARVRDQQENTPLKRAGTPEDMAEAALMLLFGSRHITGEVLICDSGFHLGGAPTKAR